MIVASLLSGCATAILNSNLDQYNDNTNLELSGSNIPGPPEGDRTEHVQPTVVVTSDGTNLLTGRTLRVTGRVDYVPAEHAVPDRYQIAWRGLRDNHSATRTHIRLLDASGRAALVLRFEEGNVILRSEDEEVNPQATVSMLLPHDVSIIIDMRGDKSVTVELTEDGERLFGGGPALGLLDGDFSSLHTVQIESATGVNYFVQDLRVLASSD